MKSVKFNTKILEVNKSSIIEILNELPENFKKDSGGGWSFLNMCINKDGFQWTSYHKIIDELVCLGNAAGVLSFPFPKEMWGALPGGMPYIVIL